MISDDFETELAARRAVVAKVNEASELFFELAWTGPDARPSLHVFWSDEDAGFIATCDIPGISAFGDTPVEAVQEIQIARDAALRGFVPHCGTCARPMQACVCGTKPAKPVPPSVPIIAPAVNTSTQSWIVLRYGVAWCTECDLAAVYCRGHA